MNPPTRCALYADHDQLATLEGDTTPVASQAIADEVALELAGLGIESA